MPFGGHEMQIGDRYILDAGHRKPLFPGPDPGRLGIRRGVHVEWGRIRGDCLVLNGRLHQIHTWRGLDAARAIGMQTTGFDGYANFETWAVHRWLANDPGLWRCWQAVACTCYGTSLDAHDGRHSAAMWRAARWALAERLRDSFEDANPLRGQAASVYTDLLAGALDEVAWAEVADVLLDDLELEVELDGLSSGPDGEGLPCNS